MLALHPDAIREIETAALFYEQSRSGLGREFLAATENAFVDIKRYPRLWRKFAGRFQRYLVQRFPFAVIYTMESDIIYVIAVIHLKRDPGYWRDRIK